MAAVRQIAVGTALAHCALGGWTAKATTCAQDAPGGLARVSRSGTGNDDVSSSCSCDKAANQIKVTVSGTGGGGRGTSNQPPLIRPDDAGTVQACPGTSSNMAASDNGTETIRGRLSASRVYPGDPRGRRTCSRTQGNVR